VPAPLIGEKSCGVMGIKLWVSGWISVFSCVQSGGLNVGNWAEVTPNLKKRRSEAHLFTVGCAQKYFRAS